MKLIAAIVCLVILLSCQENKKPIADLPDKDAGKVELYCDTLLGYTLNILDSISDADFGIDFKYNIGLSWRYISFALKDFQDKSILKNYPELDSAYNKNLNECSIDDSLGRKNHHIIETSCYKDYRFIDYATAEKWLKWWEDHKSDSIRYPHSYLVFSKPLISSDRNIIAIEIHNYCFGLCGSGITYVLERKGNRWSIIRHRTLWVS